MDTFLKFITILAYCGAVFGVLMGCVTSYLNWNYNKPNGLEKALDRVQGYTKVYRSGRFWLIAVISIAWIFAV